MGRGRPQPSGCRTDRKIGTHERATLPLGEEGVGGNEILGGFVKQGVAPASVGGGGHLTRSTKTIPSHSFRRIPTPPWFRVLLTKKWISFSFLPFFW